MLKFDLRDYVYDGQVRWTAARLHQGQTTNFRNPNGGFAPLFDGLIDGQALGCTPTQHESRLFLLDETSVRALTWDRYVALTRSQAAAAEFKGRRFILVDWYLRLSCGQPEAVVNETCSWLVFDTLGLLDPQAAHAIEAPASPTEAQWTQIRVMIFSDSAPDFL